MSRIVAYLFPLYLLLIAMALIFASCGDMGKISNQSYHCMTEGGDDYCRPQPTPIPGSSGLPGREGPPGAPGTTGPQGPGGSTGPAGSSGTNGNSGSSGTDGYSIVTSTTQLASGDVLCPAGGTLLRIARDLNRDGLLDNQDDRQQLATICNGENGSDGTNGTDGTNGQDGAPGTAAPPTPFTPVAIVDPCGDKSGVWDEVFLRMANGTLLASFSENSNGKNTRFSLLTAGSYVTTDGSNCYFSVDNTGAIYNEHY